MEVGQMEKTVSIGKRIRLFCPKYHVEECLDQIRECLEIGWTGNGFKTELFEETWMKYTGQNNALFLNSCSAALELALDVLKAEYGWDDGDEVITTPNTFVSTNHAILHNGLKPVFADIDDTNCLDPLDVERRISPKTRAVLFVGIGGNAGRYLDIAMACREKGLKLILDASHMVGTKIRGEIVGREADAVCYSFQAVKNLSTADSGMLCFNKSELSKQARKKAWLGISQGTYERDSENAYRWNYNVEFTGYKYHGNSVMAAMALAQFQFLDQDNAIRDTVASYYDENLAPYKNLATPIRIPDDCQSSHHLYQILVDKRDQVIDQMNEAGIECGVHYISNTRYSMYSYASGTCPRAEYVSDHVISLPIHAFLTDSEIQYIINTLIGILKGLEK